MPFLPCEAARGPGSKTRLQSLRLTYGIDEVGRRLEVKDNWTDESGRPLSSMSWTGRTVFLVDKTHTKRWGTDQRRQRVEVRNRRTSVCTSWADVAESDMGET